MCVYVHVPTPLSTLANTCAKAHTHAKILCCINFFFFFFLENASTLTCPQWETPLRNENSSVVWKKERDRTDGEKSSASDFHPETVHWCPTALWSPGSNNIQLTFHWRNLILPSRCQWYLIAGLASLHMHVSIQTIRVHACMHTTGKTQPWLILIQVTPSDHQYFFPSYMFLRSCCGFHYYAGKIWARS